MSNILDVKASELVKAASLQLKDKIKKPAYIDYVKSGANTERPPDSPDFWYMRSASILRQVYVNGPIGVSRLRVRYGSRKDHSMHRRHHVDSGGSIIRDALQALETLKLVQRTKRGRIITPQGKSFLDKISSELAKRSA
jgi:small subunit ribosomal protein S19e